MKKLLRIVFVFIFLLAPVANLRASEIDNRETVIEKKLNCLAKNYKNNDDLRWADICAVDMPTPQGAGRDELINSQLQAVAKRLEVNAPEQTQQGFTDFQNTADGDTKTPPLQERANFSDDLSQSDQTFEEARQSVHQFELGTELYSYKYTENIGVKVTGPKGGMFGAYQYRFGDNQVISSWNDFLHENNKVNIFRLEGRFSYGKVDYEGSGTWGGIPDLNFETRGLVGLEIPLKHHFMVTPFGGLGYRYLFNDLSKYPASVVAGQQYLSGYDRESNYIYFPLGLEVKSKFNPDWSLALKGEFDYFIWGKQISHLERSVDETGAKSGIDKLENTQKHGLGMRMSLRLTREAGPVNFFAEPFIRYWHIDDSEVSLVTYGGAASCSGGLCDAGLEPNNKTVEYGLNLGAKF